MKEVVITLLLQLTSTLKQKLTSITTPIPKRTFQSDSFNSHQLYSERTENQRDTVQTKLTPFLQFISTIYSSHHQTVTHSFLPHLPLFFFTLFTITTTHTPATIFIHNSSYIHSNLHSESH